MAHDINERPHEFCYSKNEIRYIYTVDDLSRAGLYFQVKLVIGADEIILPPLKPNSDGKVYVWLQQYIDSYLTYNIPFANAITYATSQSINFYVAVREVHDADLNPDYDVTENAHVRIALKGGIEKNRYGRNNFFNYHTDNLNWLTWQPSNRMIGLNEPVILSALVKLGNTNNMHLRATWVATNGATGDIDISLSDTSCYIVHCKVDTTTLGIIAALGVRKLHYYDVWIERSVLVPGSGIDTSPITAHYRYYINYNKYYSSYDFIYTNSLSGVDVARAVGETTSTVKRVAQQSEGGFGNDEWQTLIKGADRTYSSITLNRNYKGDFGYRQSFEEIDCLNDLLASKCIYQILDSRMVPILALQETQALGKSTDKLYSFPIEWQYAEDNEVYTPQHIALGLGNDVETY